MSTMRDSTSAPKRKRRDRTIEKARKRKRADDVKEEDGLSIEHNSGHEQAQGVAHSSELEGTEQNGEIQYHATDTQLNPKFQTAFVAVTNRENGTLNELESGINEEELSKLPLILHDNEWDVSRPAGGQLIPHRIKLTSDEKHFIFATSTSIHLYAVANSSLVDQLTLPEGQSIASYDLSASSQDTLYVAEIHGSVTRWEFLHHNNSDKTLTWFDSATTIRDLRIVPDQDRKDAAIEDAAIVLEDQGNSRLVLHRPHRKDAASFESSQVLLCSDAHVTGFEMDISATVIVANASDSILVGNRNTKFTNSLESIEFIWRKFRCKDWPISLALRVVLETPKPSNSISKKKPRPQITTSQRIDLAVGGSRGRIYLYSDLLEKLEQLELEGPQSVAGNAPGVSRIVAHELHWHQKAVQALAWSQDGNYLISGGSEAVLVLWQLSTGQKQFLPHLESPVCDITVSKSGARYAIRLGDNSAMVLSTSELSPEANINGVQSKVLVRGRTQHSSEMLRHISEERSQPDEDIQVPCISHPTAADQILLVVSGVQGPLNTQTSAAPLLQTIEIHSRGSKGILAKHVSRQALTRTNATNVGIGPNGRSMSPPNVTQLSISQDGCWLVTAEEWCATGTQSSQPRRKDSYKNVANEWRECILKFWLCDQSGQTWKLHQQMDRPHASDEYPVSSRVLALSAFKKHQKFVTLGNDSILSIWKLRSNTHEQGGLRNTQWVLDKSISLEKTLDYEPTRDTRPVRGCFAISNDDSTLAVSQNFRQGNEQLNDIVHIIDVHDGSIRVSQQGLFTGPNDLQKLAFLNQNLICLGFGCVTVWDLTSFELILRYDLVDRSVMGNLRHTACAIPHVAVDEHNSTFAVAVPDLSNEVDPKKKLQCQCSRSILGVCTVTSRKSLKMFVTKLEHLTMGLMSASKASIDSHMSSFMILDSAARIRHVRQKNAMDYDHAAAASEPYQIQTNGFGGEGQRDATPESEDEADDRLAEEITSMVVTGDSDQTRVVRPEELAMLFDHPSHAMPPLSEMFQSVVKVYSGR